MMTGVWPSAQKRDGAGWHGTGTICVCYGNARYDRAAVEANRKLQTAQQRFEIRAECENLLCYVSHGLMTRTPTAA